MAHTLGLLSLLALVCLVQQGYGIVYPTFTYDGWDTIFLDKPSYLHSIQHSFSEEQLYVFGGDHLRVVTTGKNFTVQDHVAAIDWHQEFLSLHVFHNGTDLWAIGPTNPSDYTAHPDGYDLPIALAGPLWQTLKVDGLQGFILYSVYVDDRNPNDILSYMVGWVPVQGGVNETVNQVALGVVRLHLNFNLPYANRTFTFDYATDVLPLVMNTFSIYSQFFKPQLHFQNSTNVLIIVDPATNTIFTVQVGPGTTPMKMILTQNVLFEPPGTYASSSFFHVETNLLYVGWAAQGTGNGSLISYSMSSIGVQNSLNLTDFMSNPRAIAIDDATNTLYVGFNGGSTVLKLDYLLNIQGYQRAPEYLTRMEAARVGMDHIYFITNEQHSKVARVHKDDFCSSPCPYYGFCTKGKCQCDPRLVMSGDKKSCNIPTGTSDKGAAVALGVLFALAVIAAGVGWFMVWRSRSGGYQKV